MGVRYGKDNSSSIELGGGICAVSCFGVGVSIISGALLGSSGRDGSEEYISDDG